MVVSQESRGIFSPTGHDRRSYRENDRELERGVMGSQWLQQGRGLSDSRGRRRGKRVSTVPAELSDNGVDLGTVQNLFF